MQTRKKLWLSGVVLMVLGAVGAGLYAQQRNTSSPKLSTEDYVEIGQLYSRYAHYVDRMDSEAATETVATLWAEDGTVSFNPGQMFRGRKEIAGHWLGVYTRRTEGLNSPRRFFASNNVLIEPSPEGAIGSAYFMMVKSSPEAGQPSVVESNGEYRDVLVKTRDGWKFKTRVFRRIRGGPAVW